MAGQRQEYYHGLRGSGAAGHEVHHGVEHGAGLADTAEDREGGAGEGRGHVKYSEQHGCHGPGQNR